MVSSSLLFFNHIRDLTIYVFRWNTCTHTHMHTRTHTCAHAHMHTSTQPLTWQRGIKSLVHMKLVDDSTVCASKGHRNNLLLPEGNIKFHRSGQDSNPNRRTEKRCANHYTIGPIATSLPKFCSTGAVTILIVCTGSIALYNEHDFIAS